MSTYRTRIHWRRGDQAFIDDRYSREHTWEFDCGLCVPATASPEIVPAPYSVAGNVDPEQAFVASLSSCHMLFFLAFAAKRGIIVDSYSDDAVGYMEKNSDGRLAITRVVLRPAAEYSGDSPSRQQIEKLHHRSHESCFIANSVTSEVRTEIVA